MKLRTFPLLAILALSLTACLSLADDITPPPGYVPATPRPTLGALFPASAPNLDSGAALYAEKCAACHGATGQGDGPMAAQLPMPPAALAQKAAQAQPAAWFTVVTQGNMQALMPPFNSLTDQERWDVVAYSLSLGMQEEQVAIGERIYQANCAECHSARPIDQEKLSSLSLEELELMISQGIGQQMPSFAEKLAEAEISAAATYYRALTFAAPRVSAPVSTPAPSQPPVSEAAAPAGSETPQATAESTETAGAPAPSPTPAAGGLVRGSVEHGGEGVLPSGLQVTLHGFEHDTASGSFSETFTLNAPVQANGAYEFSGLDLQAGQAFYTSVEYQGVEYSSEAVFAETGTTQFDLPLTIYDTTTDTAVLETDQAHILLDYSAPGVVTVIEFYIVSNPSGKTVVTAEAGGPVAQFGLPEGASNLQFEDGVLGGRYIETPNGFADTLSIPPGEKVYQVVFAFDLPYDAKASLFSKPSLEIAQPVSLKTRAFSVLVPQGLTVEGEGLEDAGMQSMGNGMQFQMYSKRDLPPASTFQFKVSGTPQIAETPVQGFDSSQLLLIGVGALGIVLILAGVYLFWRDRQRESGHLNDDDDEEAFDAEGSEDSEAIMDSIIALDEQFKTGNLPEEAYRERRAQLKAKLSKVL